MSFLPSIIDGWSKLLQTFSIWMVLATLPFSVAFSQSGPCSYSVSGKVLDVDTDKPIPYVTVKVRNTEKATLTNLEGEFFIDGLCEEKNTLIISCIGYCDSTCAHHYQDGTRPNIYLRAEAHELETTVIEADRIKTKGTESISQITLRKADLMKDPTRSLAAAIAREPGVTFISTGSNVQLPVIHGLYGNRILLLNNGLKHGFQNWGSDHAPEIDISAADRITIIKGASGVRFGPEALAGAVIVNPNPIYLHNHFYAGVGTGFQTNGRGINTNVEVGQGYEKWGYFANASFTKIGDRHTPDYSLTNSGKEEISVGFGTRYQHKNWNFKLYYSYLNQELALLRSSIAESGSAFERALNAETPTFIRPFSYDIGEPKQNTEHQLGKVEVDWLYSDEGKLTFRAGTQLNKRQEYDVRRNADLPIIDLNLLTTDYQLEWRHPELFKLNGLIGVQYFYQNNDNNPGTGTTPFIPNYNTNRFSAFWVESKKFGANKLEAGIRFDYETNNVRGRETNQDIFRDEFEFLNFTSSLGFVRKLSPNSTFRTNIGTAWRTPNMAELYSFGQHGFRTQFGLLRYYTNEEGELRTDRVIPLSERNVQSERGYKFINEFETQSKNNSLSISLYAHYIENYIFDRPFTVIGTIRGPMPLFIYDQIDAIFLGTDISWKRKWTQQVSGTFGASLLYTTSLRNNESPIFQPPISVNYELEWDQGEWWKFQNSSFSITPSYTFRQFQAPPIVSPGQLIDGSVRITADSPFFDFKDAPDGYFLINAAWRFKIKNLSGSISVNNLLNARYRDYLNDMRYFVDEPGRNIMFGLNYRFKAKHR